MVALDRPFTGVLNDLQRRLQNTGEYRDIINLGLGNPGTPVAPELEATLVNDLEHNKNMAPYGSSRGDLSTRKSIADFLTQVRGMPYEFDDNYNQIAITGGITETIREYFTALYNKSAAVDGDNVTHDTLRVLVPTPAYAWYFDALNTLPGIEVIKADTHDTGWKLTAKSLQGFLQQSPPPAALLLNYPCNPTGQDLTEKEWRDIADVLESHVKTNPHFRVVLDNAYKDLSFSKHKGLVEVAPELAQNVIEINSVAKFHGLAGRRGPGFTVSQNTDDITMLRKQLDSSLGIGLSYEAFLRAAFNPEYFTPERVENVLGLYRRRCKFVANYLNEQIASGGRKEY